MVTKSASVLGVEQLMQAVVATVGSSTTRMTSMLPSVRNPSLLGPRTLMDVVHSSKEAGERRGLRQLTLVGAVEESFD